MFMVNVLGIKVQIKDFWDILSGIPKSKYDIQFSPTLTTFPRNNFLR